MAKTLMLSLALLVSTAWLAAQGQYGSSQTGTSASGQTSVQGCLQGSGGSYTLTSDSGTTYQLQGETSKLNKHVGHEVEITGSSSGAGSSASTMSPNAGASPAGAQQTLTVAKVKHISKTCKNAGK